MPPPTGHLVDQVAADRAREAEPRHIPAQRTARRDPTAPTTGTTSAWLVNGHRVRLWRVAATAFLARCDCPAGQYGNRCYHLAVAADEELCALETQRASGAYATAKHGQAC